jgi:hypothetical protein
LQGSPGSFLRNLEIFNRHYHDKLPFSSVVFVTSKWGYDSEEACVLRETEYQECYWRSALRPVDGEKGARVMRLKPRSEGDRAEEESAWEIVASILRDVEERAANGLSAGIGKTVRPSL